MLVRTLIKNKNMKLKPQRKGKSMQMKAKKIVAIPPPCLEGAVCTK